MAPMFPGMLSSSKLVGSRNRFKATPHNARSRDDSRWRRLLAGFEILENRRLLAGELDPSFANGGLYRADFWEGPGGGRVNSLQILPSGKLWAVGTGNDGSYMVLYNADGSVDQGFGNDGRVRVPNATLNDSLLLSNGQLLVAGQGVGAEFYVARFNADGSLDSSFDGDGIFTITLGSSYGGNGANALSLQSDGKIIVGGNKNVDGSSGSCVIFRLLPEGILDTSFATSGIFTVFGRGVNDVAVDTADNILFATDFNTFSSNYDLLLRRLSPDGKTTTGSAQFSPGFGPIAASLSIAPNGTIYLGGSADNSSLVAKLSPNFTLDANINSGKGWVTWKPTGSTSSYVKSVQLDSSGKIVTTGSASFGGGIFQHVSRLFTSGDLDTTFDSDGQWLQAGEAVALRVLATGSIVVGGNISMVTSYGPTRRYSVTRLNNAGALDATFGDNGSTAIQFYMSSETAESVALAPSGEITFVGGSQVNVAAGVGYVGRLNDTGTAASTFGKKGLTFARVVDNSDRYNAVVQLPDGKVLAGGQASTGFIVTRFNVDGSIDTTFGSQGTAQANNALGGLGYALAVQPDGKIIVAGSGGSLATTVTSLVRFNSNGSFDTSFGSNGSVALTLGTDFSTARAVALQSDGKIVIAGQGFAVVRLNSNGSLDTTFNSTGRNLTAFGAGSYAYDISIQWDGKIVVAGSVGSAAARNFAVARFNPNGSLDTSFDGDGKLTLDLSGQEDYGQAVLLQPNGKILVGGGAPGGVALVRFQANGSIDSSFGTNGQVITNVGLTQPRIRDLAWDSQGRIVAVGSGSSGTDDDIVVARFLSGPDANQGPSFVVNSLADTVDPTDGLSTFREAVLAANSNGSSATDTIAFAIAGTITFTSTLPSINTPTIIDATSAPGYANAPVVELNAGNVGVGQIGLNFVAGSSTLRAVALNRSGGVGVWLTGAGNLIERNYIGTDLTGTLDRGNSFQGLFVNSNNNTIQNNLVSGNDANGIWINGSGNNGRSNLVRSNTIGLTAAGTAPLGNGINGVLLSDGARDNTVVGNVIAKNGNTGIWIIGAAATNNRVQGNFVGTTASSQTGLGNATTGVRISDGAVNNWIGTDGDGTNDASEGNVISGNGQAGIDIVGLGTSNNVVAGNRIGTNATGTAAISNAIGVLITSGASNNRIGTNGDSVADIAERNLVSGNSGNGIQIDGAGTSSNRIAGNFIGIDSTGTAPLANLRNGVLVQGTNSGNRIGGLTGQPGSGLGNVVSGNRERGIWLSQGSANEILGNLVGLNASGTAAIGNVFQGIELNATSNARVGGIASGSRNVIGGNLGGFGEVWVFSGSGSTIQGNYIGINATGTSGLNALGSGIQITGASNTLIGGGVSGAGNLIGGLSSDGIWIRNAVNLFGVNAVASGNKVQGNTLGVAPNGTSALPMTRAGIRLSAGTNQNWIGTDSDGVNDETEGNTITNAALAGVVVEDVDTIRNAVQRNSLYGNGGLAIDLGADGVTPNDVLDADSGPNQLTNYPVLRQVFTGASTRIVGVFSAAASLTYTLDFYANDSVDSSGFGEAKRWIGKSTITTAANGQTTFDVTLAVPTLASETISVTATDPLNNTSELSRSLGLDMQAPSSRVTSLLTPATSLSIPLQVIGIDPVVGGMPASGVMSYVIEISLNGAAYAPWMIVPADNPSAVFTAQSGNTYAFRSIARDWAGNVESKPITNEALVVVPDLDAPETSVRTVTSSTPAFQVTVGGTDIGGALLAQFELYVSIDGSVPFKFATLAAQTGPAPGTYEAATTFQARADGNSYRYRFYSIGIDGRNNIESAPSSGDFEFSARFDPPVVAAVTSFDINRGGRQRSFVRYIDTGLNTTTGIDQIVNSIADSDAANDRIVLTRFNSDGTGTGAALPLQGKLRFDAIDQVMRIDFGAAGIGGNANSTAGNGYYALALDLDGNGSLETVRHFYRLLGDTDNNRTVNGTDFLAVSRRLGAIGANLDEDLNGDGLVNSADSTLVRSGLASSIGANLPLDD